uniref:Uncharacterized protein n=1 Tax=Mycena chlorophos TaxID=658473 RepID=A0ABQ0L5R5_MYCCL|nr:predicted protein [Mycena chlorophos]
MSAFSSFLAFYTPSKASTALQLRNSQQIVQGLLLVPEAQTSLAHFLLTESRDIAIYMKQREKKLDDEDSDEGEESNLALGAEGEATIWHDGTGIRRFGLRYPSNDCDMHAERAPHLDN